jgi:thymidylate synthase
VSNFYSSFSAACDDAEKYLLDQGEHVDSGRWQGYKTEGRPDLATREILNLTFNVRMPTRIEHLEEDIRPNVDWANQHFRERIGGIPMNPDPSYTQWPWWHGQDVSKQAGDQFTHTYSERFWPPRFDGIRYRAGDYLDVLALMEAEPFTRQAYLPIFFPEDTGAKHGGRTPCTLGYHFLRRRDHLHMWYEIRSCDAVRHFRDDVYLAARLQLHTVGQLQLKDPTLNGPGTFYFCAHSFHVHMGDLHHLVERHET